MASTDVEVLKSPITKADGTEVHTILHKPPSQKLGDEKNKELGCGNLTQKCFGDDVKPSAGMCMIAFGVPLLLPGITLTAVAFDDETGFSKYGALHIIGMVMLGVSTLLIIIGVALNIRFKSKVAPEDRPFTVSTHEKPTKDLNNQENFTAASGENDNNANLTRDHTSNIQPNNFMVETGHNEAGGEHHVHFQTEKVGSSSFLNTLDATRLSAPRDVGRGYSREEEQSTTASEDFSSSYDSSDSDDFSSASYVISEDVEGAVSGEGGVTATSGLKSVHNLASSDSQLAESEVKRPGDRQRKLMGKKTRPSSCDAGINVAGRDSRQTALSNNFFRASTESVTSVNEIQNESRSNTRKLPTTPETKTVQQGRRKEREVKKKTTENLSPQAFSFVTGSSTSCGEGSPQFMSDTSSPGSRQRLQALRSDVLLSDQSDAPCDVTNTNPDIHNYGSNTSVFCGEDDHLTITVVSNDKSFANSNALPKRRSDPTPLWTESANGNLPRLSEKHARLSESTGAIKDNNSLSELHISRPAAKTSISPITLEPILSPKGLRSPDTPKKSVHFSMTPFTYHETSLSSLASDSLEYRNDNSYMAMEPKPLPKMRVRTLPVGNLTSSVTKLASTRGPLFMDDVDTSCLDDPRTSDNLGRRWEPQENPNIRATDVGVSSINEQMTSRSNPEFVSLEGVRTEETQSNRERHKKKNRRRKKRKSQGEEKTETT